ncbi:MAG: hypothetical protein ABW048_02115, partial [Sphingobium sp.]
LQGFHAMYKKIAIGTVVLAPLLAQIASQWTPSAATVPTVSPADVAVPATAPALARKSAPGTVSAMHYSPITPAGGVMQAADPMDTTPTLDPTSIAASAMDLSGATPPPAPAVTPVPMPAPISATVPDMPSGQTHHPKKPEGPDRY